MNGLEAKTMNLMEGIKSEREMKHGMRKRS